MPFTELIPLDRCHRDAGVYVEHGGRGLAVFWLTDPQRVFVIDNSCPHAGGDLSSGILAGPAPASTVRCRYHYWEIDLGTGECTHSSRARVRCYPAEIRDGIVWADLPVSTP